MTMPETRAEAIDRLTNEYTERTANLDTDDVLALTADQFRQCLEECVAKTGRVRFLKNPPTFRQRPYGSLFLRLYRWHGGNGQLDGYMMAKWDADHMRRLSDLVDWKVQNFPEFDAFDTAAILARGGSPAANAWRRALGR